MESDILIAREAKIKPIVEIAEQLGLKADDLELLTSTLGHPKLKSNNFANSFCSSVNKSI